MKKLLISCLVFLSGFISVHGQVYTGAAYYPEHTDKEQVEKDARLMKEAHFNIARIDRKSTRLNSSHRSQSRMPSSA